MKKFIRICLIIMIDLFNSVRYFIVNNLRNFVTLLNIILPYLMLYIGQYVYKVRDRYAVGGEVFIPLIIGFLIYFVRAYANKIGKGSDIPVPSKRFTSEDDFGEVSISNNRVQELILYMSDLEDWMERKGML